MGIQPARRGLTHGRARYRRRHRGLLGDVMDAAGFINYPAEWWHWSYGDRYRAFQAGRATTRYGPL
ncbi:MAG: M15 family metallopeptidase [Streptosporangiaceae bacterium]